MNQLPQEFNELIYYILMDESFHLSYPHIRERLLLIAEKFDKDNYQVYIKSTEVCCSFSAACQLLSIDEYKSQVNQRRNSALKTKEGRSNREFQKQRGRHAPRSPLFTPTRPPGGCPRCPGTPLGQKMSGGRYRDEKLFGESKIFFTGGHPP